MASCSSASSTSDACRSCRMQYLVMNTHMTRHTTRSGSGVMQLRLADEDFWLYGATRCLQLARLTLLLTSIAANKRCC